MSTAIQTVNLLRRYIESVKMDEKLVRDELSTIEKYRHWEVLGYPSKDAMLEAEIGTATPL